MSTRIIFIIALLGVGVGLLALRNYDPHLPSETKVLAAARMIEEFEELEKRYGPLNVTVRSGVTKFHTGNHGGADIIGIQDATVSWSYYPANCDVIVTRITIGETTVYEETREPGEVVNSE